MSTVPIQDLHELRRRLAPHLGGAVKAIVFGSAARGKADEWSDLGFAKLGVDGGYHAQACFMCQQAAEKALKVLDTLAPRDPALTALREAAQQLDQYYVPTRYPNGLPSGTPAEVFTKRQASEAVALAARILDQARSTIASRPP